MDRDLLVSEAISAGADLVRRMSENWSVKAAFWLRGSDEQRSYLYLALEGLDGQDKFPAYHDLGQFSRENPSLYLDTFRVKVIGDKNPMAQAAINVNQKLPSPQGYLLDSSMFGDVFAEQVYVYPTPLPAAVA